MEQDEILFIEAINRQEPKAYQTFLSLILSGISKLCHEVYQ